MAAGAFHTFGQDSRKMEYYFSKVLSGKCPDTPIHKKIKPKKLTACREKVWQAWKVANVGLAEERLLPATPFTDLKAGSFQIPEKEEPSAVMPYYHARKGERPSNGYPFFIYLHGSGPKNSEWTTGRQLCEQFDDAPSIYFIPQIPHEGEYYRWWQRGKQWIWEKLLRQTLLSDSIDPDRLYVFGISEGGYGSQRLASFYADYWAAAGPMAGGEPLYNAPAENCGNLAFSLLTGSEDSAFYRNTLTEYTRMAFDSLQSIYPAAYVHRIKLLPGYGHGIDYSVTTPWLKLHKRVSSPRSWVWEDFEMDGIHRKGFHNLIVTERPDSTLRTSYIMKINDNNIEVNVCDVHYITLYTEPAWGIPLRFARTYTPSVKGRFKLYLNELMVDLGRPVKLTVNGTTVFAGKLQCDVNNMLESLSCFYDPRRIYPAAIEVDLSLLQPNEH